MRKEFEKWAVLTYSNNRAVINEKKGADKGIDGVAYLFVGADEYKKAILSVKSGNVGAAFMRDLRGTIEREEAACGILITLEDATKPMAQEAREAGQFKTDYLPPVDRLQIVTIQEILDGARMQLPLVAEVAKRAQKSKVDTGQTTLFGN